MITKMRNRDGVSENPKLIREETTQQQCELDQRLRSSCAKVGEDNVRGASRV